MSTSNKACCTLPPVQTDYKPKGTMEKVAGIDSYVTGDANATNVILCVYDIFGFWETTQQGADMLAAASKAKVVMPDFLRNKPWPIDAFPPRNDDESKRFNEWLETVGNVGNSVKEVLAISTALKEGGAERLGLYGFCWGGKVVSYVAGQSSPFVGVALVHPAFVAPEDANNVTVPIAFFPSKDEPKKDTDEFWRLLKEKAPKAAEKSEYVYYGENHHGFAAARADLKDPSNFKAYEDVYNRLCAFFCGLF
ncbi:carboxymethylenebutenolidase [Malassezia vespertilionis]|uniref:Dienelactone hydrolase domain-containing protein n=1 Tax=Malassezia vespertilionis TaxID=2020962 RepID=A0A2N1JDP7_9BASI|nr:carboxymethylenebutenolidase [Malassezia vespertilionis]PKI84675.1 hypothetical protein MVES_001315 [Malassezia vespertilionis]WFD06056.1 carboxymethylenebutenolidase [Malassezia vespertilionis]